MEKWPATPFKRALSWVSETAPPAATPCPPPFIWAMVTMIEKIMVVAPTTAVPIRTGLAVALKVLPAPSFSSRNSLPFSKFGSKPKSRFTSSLIPLMFSIRESS